MGNANQPLTDKQIRFVDEYMIDFNATQATIRAGYSKKAARQQGSTLMSYPYIQQAVAQRSEVLKAKTDTDAEWKRLQLRKLVDEGMEQYTNGTDNKAAHGAMVVKALAELNKMDGDYQPSKQLVGIVSQDPVADLLDEIVANAKRDGPLRHNKHLRDNGSQ